MEKDIISLSLIRCETQMSGEIVGGPIFYCCQLTQHKAVEIPECLAFHWCQCCVDKTIFDCYFNDPSNLFKERLLTTTRAATNDYFDNRLI